MTTNWALPTTIDQYSGSGAEQAHISWIEVDNFSGLKNLDGRSVKTSRDLKHIARDPRHDLFDKTYFLRCTGFNFNNLPDQITGIELKLSMNRRGRITDDTIQLCLNDELIGINQASLNLDLIKIYGGENSQWDATLTATDIQQASFGVVLRFQSHLHWPHSCSPLIDAVELRVH